mmetsp:Transcript_73287/g.145794  ORF Transcript_73287/g.145794 Transcript_73287/m.145794 type:complete len:120 (-) Transcript_73287:17-376(-)
MQSPNVPVRMMTIRMGGTASPSSSSLSSSRLVAPLYPVLGVWSTCMSASLEFLDMPFTKGITSLGDLTRPLQKGAIQLAGAHKLCGGDAGRLGEGAEGMDTPAVATHCGIPSTVLASSA